MKRRSPERAPSAEYRSGSRSGERLCNCTLFLNDLSVLEHGDAAVARHLAFERNCFSGVLGELSVHRLVIADDEIKFAVTHDPNRTAALDAFGRTTRVLVAHRAVIDITHYVDDLASNCFLSRGGGIFLFVLMRQGHGRSDERSGKHDRNTSLNYGQSSAVGVHHRPSSDDFFLGQLMEA